LLDTSQTISELSDDSQATKSSAFFNIWTPDLR